MDTDADTDTDRDRERDTVATISTMPHKKSMNYRIKISCVKGITTNIT